MQTMASLLRHPTHETTRIIIALSTAKFSEAVPGAIRFVTTDHLEVGGAVDATSLVIDPTPVRGPGTLNTAFMSTSGAIQPLSGNLPVIPKTDRTSALRRSSSHSKRLTLRDSRRPYPPIQLQAQWWEGSGIASTRQGGGFTNTSGHHRSNEMDAVVEDSNQLTLRHMHKPFLVDTRADSGIYQQATAGDPSSVTGLVEDIRQLAAHQAARHNVIASSYWSTTTQSNGELQAFPCHVSSLPQSNQCGSSTITFPSIQTAPSFFHSPCQSPTYDLTKPLEDGLEQVNFQSMPSIQQSLFFRSDRQPERSLNDTPEISIHKTSYSESGTHLSYRPMSRGHRVAHASSSQCPNQRFEHGANGSTSASDYK
jgi:hypothetical protein